MAGFGVQIRKRLERLRKAQADVPEIMYKAARAATMAAVETATQNTPPNGATIAGTNMRTGSMAQHWATDSRIDPVGGALSGGGMVVTVLANNMQYASYVNDGHRMDKHFVPGITNKNGIIESVAPGDNDGGMMVGTKTQYVQGLYMKEKAIGKYKDTLRTALDSEIRKALS